MEIILSVSIIFQLAAVIISINLIKVTEKYFAWILIAIAITFMAVRRSITLISILQETKIVAGATAAEYVALIISVLLSAGLFFMIPIFKSIKKNEKDLIIKNKQLDIARKNAEKKEEYVNMLFELSPIGLALTKLTGELIEINSAYSEIIGYSIEETLKLSYWDITPTKYSEQEQKQLKSLNTKGGYGPYEKEYIHKSGKLIPVRLQGRIIEKNGEKYVWSSVENITENKKKQLEIQKQNEEYAALNEEYKTQNEDLIKAKEKAEESEKRFKAAFYTSPDSVNINKLNGEYVEINQGFTRLTGFTNEDVIGKLSSEIDIWSDPKDREKLIAGLTQNGIVENLEAVFKTKNGDLVPGLMSAKIIELKKEKHILSVTRSIFELKKFETELIFAKEKAEESDRLKTEFINNISHEIRTPMNGILGFSDILNKPNLTTKKRSHYINIIQNSGNQLMQIIDDILEISKLGTKQVKINENETCLNHVLSELFSIFDMKAKENKTPLHLNKGLADKESIILTDKTKLNTILSNLLENSLKFTAEGFIEFGYQLKNNNIELYVKDSGIGIKQESHEIIFKRFSQEEKNISQKVGGLGLGLSIAKENAELLGGKITLKSEKGKGSIFFVTIPFKPINKKILKSNSDSSKEKISKKQDKHTILIVEDEEVNYLYINTLLEYFEMNLKILHAKHGKEAVEMCKENSEIDIVLMDLKMPIMNGFEATKVIKEFRPDLPIIAQTAYSTLNEKKQAISAGCNDFISKPISEKTLKGIMNKYLITIVR